MDSFPQSWINDIIHELRTPIAVMRAQIEAIQDGVNPADQHTLEILLTQVLAMSRLTDDIYTLARSDVGQLHYHLAEVAPLDLIGDAVSAFRERLAQAGLMMELGDLPPPDLRIKGDAGRLRQVLFNLLENARRYTDSGGWVRIWSKTHPRDLEIRIEDTAPGVPAAALPQLFDRFFRVDASRGRAVGGCGIGLSICRSIVNAHGGAIDAQPSPLGGLAVIIRLPLSLE